MIDAIASVRRFKIHSALFHFAVSLLFAQIKCPTPVGFEPTRGDPIGLAGRRLNHSAKVSLDEICIDVVLA